MTKGLLLVIFVFFPCCIATAGVADSSWRVASSPLVSYSSPIDEERYLIRPGEQLTITFVGTTLEELELTVDAQGRIVDRELGVLYLANLTLSEAKTELREALDKLFQSDQIVISVGPPRTVTLAVSGFVINPGRYTVISSQPVSDLIDSAGGLATKGSSRHIELKSSSNSYPVDLERARYLFDELSDPPVYAGDRVYVYRKGTDYVRVSGAVLSPGTIEYLSTDSPEELVAMAGGFSASDKELLYVIRDGIRLKSSTTSIQSGDEIFVPYSKSSSDSGFVSISGAIKSGGRYTFSTRISVADLIDKAGGLSGRANNKRIVLFRMAESDAFGLAPPGRYPLMIDSKHLGFPLRAYDSIVVPVKVGYVSVTGAVSRPGLLPYQIGASVKSYLLSAGQINTTSDENEIVRVDRLTLISYRVSLDDTVLDGDSLIVSKPEGK